MMRGGMIYGAMVLLLGCRASESTAEPEPEPRAIASAPAPASKAEAPEAEGDAASATPEPERIDPVVEARQAYDHALQFARITRTQCPRAPAHVDLDALVEAYQTLAPYERSPERDRAIRSLERCRQIASAVIAQAQDPNLHPEGPAPDHTLKVGQAVDEANARTTKRLSITVKGSQVTVDDSGRPSKPPKRALEGYCAKANAPDGTKVTQVADERGQLSCSSQFSFSKQPGYVDRRMQIAAPFEIESTQGKKTPGAAAQTP